MNLPWIFKRPIKVGDIYPITDIGRRSSIFPQTIRIVSEVKFGWPCWVVFEVSYIFKDNLYKFHDFTGREGSCFLNVWGISIIRTRLELFQYLTKTWFRSIYRRITRII